MSTKSQQAFRTISEVSTELDVPAHVLRFWETKFPQIKPMKRGGGRRYYRPEDISLLKGVREMLHIDGYSIKGVQKALREQGVRAIADRVDHEAHAGAGDEAAAETAVPMSDGERRELEDALASLQELRGKLTEH